MRDGGGMRFNHDVLDDTLQVGEDVARRDADSPNALSPEPLITRCVATGQENMVFPIHLHTKPHLMAVEVENERANRMLAAEA